MDQDPIRLRPAQEEILRYRGGRMAVSAVPGSGKTFTLSLLAAQLIAAGGSDEVALDIAADQQVLIVTYLNASVETFRARIRQRLEEMGLPPTGFDVRTLHSLGLEIVRLAQSSLGDVDGPAILDDVQSQHLLSQAIDGWIDAYPTRWHDFLVDDTPQTRARWRSSTETMARAYMRTAKNARHRPTAIAQALDAASGEDVSAEAPLNLALLTMLNGIYDRYQVLLDRQGALDFDDLIWTAVDLLEQRPDLTGALRDRWPYILEDEAQDSIPLQEALLQLLAGPDGNLVRVGDPNQAITSTFTAAHPRFFTAFAARPDVVRRALPNSGRSAPLIIGAANTILDWVIDHHPVPEVRANTFHRQHIVPTPPGDAQPNPPDSEAGLRIRVYRHREDEELPDVVRLALAYAHKYPQRTLAILVPTNYLGYRVANLLDDVDADYDNLLRGGGREREIAGALQSLLALLGNPLDRRALVGAFESLYELEHPAARLPLPENGEAEAALKRFQAILRSVAQPEALLFPTDGEAAAALPAGVADPDVVAAVETLATFLRRIFALRPLPVDDLALAMGDELFAHGPDSRESDLAIAYQIGNVLRSWRDLQPHWRLPDLAAELADVASGRRRLPVSAPSDLGFEPTPGRVTLATQHGAKGLEWDAVFLIGIDGQWVPNTLDAYFMGVDDVLGGDPSAEVTAQLRALMEGEAGTYPGLSPTESAHVDIISERLRLLYVGITRARRFLQISRSRATRRASQDRDAEPTTVMGELYRYWKSLDES